MYDNTAGRPLPRKCLRAIDCTTFTEYAAAVSTSLNGMLAPSSSISPSNSLTLSLPHSLTHSSSSLSDPALKERLLDCHTVHAPFLHFIEPFTVSERTSRTWGNWKYSLSHTSHHTHITHSHTHPHPPTHHITHTSHTPIPTHTHPHTTSHITHSHTHPHTTSHITHSHTHPHTTSHTPIPTHTHHTSHTPIPTHTSHHTHITHSHTHPHITSHTHHTLPYPPTPTHTPHHTSHTPIPTHTPHHTSHTHPHTTHTHITCTQALQVCMQGVLESLVLLDRRSFLKEHQLAADLVPVFDDNISPRNMALLATRPTSDTDHSSAPSPG